MSDDAQRPTTVLTARFAEAVGWASILHADQSRKGTRVPYVSHLLGVASLVLEDGGTEDEAIAGVLHDAIEDCDASEEEIRTRFGTTVAEIVVACTDQTVGERGAANWRERKERYLEHLTAPDVPSGALRVAAADKLHNARSMLADLRTYGPVVWERFNAAAAEQRWYYTRIAELLPDRHDSVVTRELRRVIAELVAEIDRSA